MAKQGEIYIGARFGKLTVSGELIRARQATVPVRCDCGVDKVTYVHHLGVQVTSCGTCMRTPVHHGMSRTPEYRTWVRMIQRCTNPKSSSWDRYGGRGVTVHPRFRASFTAFYREIGPRPSSSHSVDRINNERGYEPGNVRWATRNEQAQNRSSSYVCRRGHRREGDNVALRADGRRACRACGRINAANARARRKAS